MSLPRRPFLVVAAVALLSLSCATAVHAQAYPNKPIKMIVTFPAGGGADYVARVIAPKLGDALGQSVVIDNRAGAGGVVGDEIAARSTPDGYTLLLGAAGALTI